MKNCRLVVLKTNWRRRWRIWIIPAIGIILWLSFTTAVYADDVSADVVKPRLVTDLEPNFRKSVLKGWRSFQTSFAADGVACVNCHPHYKNVRLWGRAYPKVEVFDGTSYQVKGLRQVVLEALEKHTDLLSEPRLALAEDLVAYIAWRGDGQIITPGYSRSLLPAAEDLDKLRSSVERGQELFHDFGPMQCVRCHEINKQSASTANKIPVGRAAATFPRFMDSFGRMMCLETFLSCHLRTHTNGGGVTPGSREITDLAAYLVSLADQETFSPGGSVQAASK